MIINCKQLQHGWIFDSLTSMLKKEYNKFIITPAWMSNADAYYVQPVELIESWFVHKALIRFTSYHINDKQVELANQAPILVAHCPQQIQWLKKHGVRKPDAIICAGYEPNIILRNMLPQKFTIGVFGNERQQSYLEDEDCNKMGNKWIKGTDRIPKIAKFLEHRKKEIKWLFAGPGWGRHDCYVQLKNMGFEVETYHYPITRVVEGYHKIDCLLITSRTETGPTAGLDALAAGVPVISTLVGQMKDLAAMIYDNWDQAAAYILNILDNRNIYFEKRFEYKSLLNGKSRQDFAKQIISLIQKRIFE